MESDSGHKKAIVIGAGVAGLCCTHRLMRAFGPEHVLCIEKAPRAGGYIQSETIDGYVCDWGPNGFLDKEPATLEWIDELGITDELIQADAASARRFLLINGKLKEMKPPPGFLLTDILSIPGRLRLLCEPFIAQRTSPDPESIWNFASRRIGREAADTLVSAMVLGVYGGNAKELSLRHAFPRMAEMEAEHGSLIKAMKAKAREARANGTKQSGGPAGPGGTLTTFRTGIGRLTQRAAELVEPSLALDLTIARLTKTTNGIFHIETDEHHENLTADHVILALPAHASGPLLQHIAPDLADAIANVPTQPIAVICTGHDRADVPHDTRGFGFLVPPNQHRDVLGCIWSSSVFPGCAPEGKVFLRTMIGGALHPHYVTQSDDELLTHVREDVFRTLGITAPPEFIKIYRHRKGIPQYALRHHKVLDAVAKAESAHPGLHFTGNSYHGISMNDAIKHATALVQSLAR